MSIIYLNRNEVISSSSILVDPFKEGWKYVLETNCYAYALGLDIPVNYLAKYEDSIHYDPGFFGGMNLSAPFTEEKLFAHILSDMDALNLCCSEVSPDYNFGKNEWKIAVFGAVTDKEGKYKDFHFLRQTKPGFMWTHKQGFNLEPTNCDSDNKVILDPTKCKLYVQAEDNIFDYKYLKTLCLGK